MTMRALQKELDDLRRDKERDSRRARRMERGCWCGVKLENERASGPKGIISDFPMSILIIFRRSCLVLNGMTI